MPRRLAPKSQDLFEVLEIFHPRTEHGRLYGPWLNIAGRQAPAIPETPPAPGQWAPGWPWVGGGLRILGDEVELPEDAEVDDSKLAGQQLAIWNQAKAAARRPAEPLPEEEPAADSKRAAELRD